MSGQPDARAAWWARHSQAVEARGGDPDTFMLTDPHLRDVYYEMLRADPRDEAAWRRLLDASGEWLGVGRYPR